MAVKSDDDSISSLSLPSQIYRSLKAFHFSVKALLSGNGINSVAMLMWADLGWSDAL